MPTPSKNFFAALEIKETVEKFFADAAPEYERFKADRAEIETSWKISDYMYAAAQNRTLLSSEKSKGMNLNEDTRANVGSVLFHAQVNRLAALLVSIMRSRPDLFRYETIGEESDDAPRAKVLQHLARYTVKADRIHARLPEIAVHVFKYSTSFVFVTQQRTYKQIMKVTPEYEETIGPDGLPVQSIVGEKRERIEVTAQNHPHFEFLHNDRIYMDRWVSGVQGQNTIVVLSLRNRSDLEAEVKAGNFYEDAVAAITEADEWDGNEGTTIKQEESKNRARTATPTGKGLYLQWDVFRRVPIDDSGKYSDDVDSVIWWGTTIGNTINGGKAVRLERNPDPDDEFPIEAINVMPDNSDSVYHTSLADVLRSLYSTDCTLLNLALDNSGQVNDPAMLVVDGAHRIKDFSYKKGQRWPVDDVNALKLFEPRDVTQSTALLRNQIQSEAKMAAGTDGDMMGEFAGARTSASEYLGVSRNSRTPVMMMMDYVLQQLLGFMGRKMKSYWQAYGPPPVIQRIADLEKAYPLMDKALSDDADIVVNIVDEFEDDTVKQQQMIGVLQVIGQVPAYQQSETHKINLGNLIKSWLETMRWTTSKIVEKPMGVDSVAWARAENNMLLSGRYIAPVAGENTAVHLAEHRAERMKWRGMEGSEDERAKNLLLLDRHIEETEAAAKAQSGTAMPFLPSPSQATTPGQVAGGEMGASAGAMTAGSIPGV